MKKALVALPDEVWDIIDRDLEGKMGTGYSDTIRGIVLSWLSEKGYLTNELLFEQVKARLEEEGWIRPAKSK